MHKLRPYCLSIAGHDPSGGAGLLADIKTFEQLNSYGLGVSSAITFQNDVEFIGIEWLQFKHIEAQLEPLKKFPVRSVKIGLIQNLEVLIQLVDLLQSSYGNVPIVWDPVLNASAGFTFHSNLELTSLDLHKLELITPNSIEYQQLGLEKFLTANILLKGGHADSGKGTDTLYLKDKYIEIEGKPFSDDADKHGTGCVLSAAITAFIAQEESLENACRKGKQYVEKFMLSNKTYLGYHKL